MFVNSTLTPLQIKKLEKWLNDYKLEWEEWLRWYFTWAASVDDGDPTDISSSSGYVTGETSEIAS